jgi:ATP-binding cassette subfamily B protein
VRADFVLVLQLINRMARRELGLRWILIAGVGAELVGLAMSVAAPFLLKATIDVLGAGEVRPLKLEVLVALFVVAWTGPNLLAALRLLPTHRLVDNLYTTLVEPIMRQQLPRLGRGRVDGSGGLASTLERLPFSLQLVIEGLIWRAAPLLVQVVFGLASLAVVLPGLYAVLLGAVLLLYTLTADIGAASISRQASAVSEETARLGQERADVLRNAARVVANGAETFERRRLRYFADARQVANAQFARLIGRQAAWQYGVLSLGLMVLMIIVARDVRAHHLQISDFVLLQAFAFRFALPLGGLALMLRQAGPAFANLREVLALGAGGPAPVDARLSDRPLRGALELRNVSFRYAGGEGVKEVSLSMSPGQVVALVGHNGSGKSTLARLMAALLDPDEGTVCVGGHPLASLSETARTSTILYAPQRISLFRRSLLDNGLYPPSRSDADALTLWLRGWAFEDSGVIDLGRAAGETGAALSGGQLQKLELARLCAVDAPILILDESTSALDRTSEAEVLKALRTAFAGRLLILVTHDRSLAESADMIVLMKSGRMVAHGAAPNLQDLADYRSLWGD